MTSTDDDNIIVVVHSFSLPVTHNLTTLGSAHTGVPFTFESGSDVRNVRRTRRHGTAAGVCTWLVRRYGFACSPLAPLARYCNIDVDAAGAAQRRCLTDDCVCVYACVYKCKRPRHSPLNVNLLGGNVDDNPGSTTTLWLKQRRSKVCVCVGVRSAFEYIRIHTQRTP